MGTVVAQLFSTADGVLEAPERWHFPFVDAALTAEIEAFYRRIDVLLLGRRTFEIFASSWPSRPSSPLGDRINALPKVVVSSSDTALPWPGGPDVPPSTLDDVARLRTESGSTIGLVGSLQLTRGLLDLGVIDEVQLLIHPVLLGPSGGGLASADQALQLLSVSTTPAGVLDARYRPLPLERRARPDASSH